ncbi:MAG: hypothetical protein AAGJ54_13085 [Planctomycetota bacterium]
MPSGTIGAEERVKAKRKIVFGDGFEVAKGALGTSAKRSGEVWAYIKFDADTSDRQYRIVSRSDVVKV